MDTPYTTELMRQEDGSWVVRCRAIFMVPEGADLSEEDALVEQAAVREAHRAAAALVRHGLAPS
jgi:hypothetical protein